MGSQILGIGLFITLFYLVASLVRGPRAPDNPWKAGSMEWQTASPPPADNFEDQPRFEQDLGEFDEIHPDGKRPQEED